MHICCHCLYKCFTQCTIEFSVFLMMIHKSSLYIMDMSLLLVVLIYYKCLLTPWVCLYIIFTL